MSDEKYTDFSNVEDQRLTVLPEEFTEGPYGSARRKGEPVRGKSTEWREGQYVNSRFTYENRTLHQDLPRKFPGAHPTHDDPNKDEQQPYTIE